MIRLSHLQWRTSKSKNIAQGGSKKAKKGMRIRGSSKSSAINAKLVDQPYEFMEISS